MQETRVQSISQADPMCQGAARPMHHNFWGYAPGPGTTATEPPCHNSWSPFSPKAQASQEKLLHWEAGTPQLESSPHSPQLEKSPSSSEDPAQAPKIQKIKKDECRGLPWRSSGPRWFSGYESALQWKRFADLIPGQGTKTPHTTGPLLIPRTTMKDSSWWNKASMCYN